MVTSVELREKLAAKQDGLAKAFELAGEDNDFGKKEVLEHLDAKSTQEAVEKIKALNLELDDLFKKAEEAEIQEIADGLTRAVREFSGDPARQRDDHAVVVLKYC